MKRIPYLFNNHVIQRIDKDMNNESFLKIYEKLLDDALTTVDLKPYWCATAPNILSACELTCNDGIMASLYLVSDLDMEYDGEEMYLWLAYDSQYLEFPLYCGSVISQSCWSKLHSKEVTEKVIGIIRDTVDGGKDKIVEHMMELKFGILKMETKY